MSKHSLVFKTEEYLKQCAENNVKLLFTTHGFKLLGIITSDKMRPEEGLGVRRRWIKGLVMENGSPLKPEDRIFETSLHRKNPKSGQLEDIIAHEDDTVIIMERKTFDLSDDENNFQFMPNIHLQDRIHQMLDEIEEGRRRISRLSEENNQALLDTEHFKRQAISVTEREKTQSSLINRLTRENSQLQEQIGNLESAFIRTRAKNLEYESTIDEQLATAQEIGTIKGMTSDDVILHAVGKKKQLHSAMLDIEPSGTDEGGSIYDELDDLKEQMEQLKGMLTKITGENIPQQKTSQNVATGTQKPAG